MTFLYLNTDEMQQYRTIATTLISTLEQSGITVTVRTWREVFHIGYMKNPFDELVDKTFIDTRSKFGNKTIC